MPQYRRVATQSHGSRRLEWCSFARRNLYGLTSCSRFVASLAAGYNHDAHELLRLYGCLRIAMGWIIFHLRSVDDGRFRRSVCEALFVCYMLQSIAVLRAQFTERSNFVNWIAISILGSMGLAYGRFRFGNGGQLIKVYELPSKMSSDF